MGPKVCVFGAGAIGGYLGAQLRRAGFDVGLVARGPHLAAMQKHGLRLRTGGQEQVVDVRCTDVPSELGIQDFVIVTLKANQIAGAVDSMLPLLGPSTSIVTTSNGLPYWFFDFGPPACRGMVISSIDPDGRQRKLLGSERALGLVVFPATEMVEPGVIRHDHGRKLPIGEPAGGRSERLALLHEVLLAADFDAPIRHDIRDEIWLKLWGNLCLNPMSALTGATVDVITTDPGTRAICRSMMSEMAAIGEKVGLKLRVDAERRLDGAAGLGPHKMSMLQDLERGRTMEIEEVVGVVQELGQKLAVPTPTIDVVLALIRQRAASVPLQ
ncbi:MAG TPA: 2-dehydropantoate 2-reductase [Casimicrobiaceae bacterium]|nr:2-dehydropantoate 2-reductase [Casimicrobiaceae bacterium]